MDNQHMAMWGGLTSNQRQGRILISGPSPTARTRLLSFNRTQFRAVTGHYTLKQHLYIMGLIDSPSCRRFGAEEETLAHVLCECEALASLRHTNLGSFFLDQEDVRSLSLRAIWNFSKGIGFTWLGHQITGHKGPDKKRPMCIRTKRAGTHLLFYCILLYSILFYRILFYSKSTKVRGSYRKPWATFFCMRTGNSRRRRVRW